MKWDQVPEPYRQMLSPGQPRRRSMGKEEIRQAMKEAIRLKKKNGMAIADAIQSRMELVQPEPRLLYCLPEGWEAITLREPTLLYKVVAVVGSEMYSVFDGITKYKLGQRLSSRRGVGNPLGWPPLECCFYAHATPEQAVNTLFPKNSALYRAPKLLLQVKAEGRAYRNSTEGVWAFNHLTPMALLSDVTEGSSFIISTRYISPPH